MIMGRKTMLSWRVPWFSPFIMTGTSVVVVWKGSRAARSMRPSPIGASNTVPVIDLSREPGGNKGRHDSLEALVPGRVMSLLLSLRLEHLEVVEEVIMLSRGASWMLM